MYSMICSGGLVVKAQGYKGLKPRPAVPWLTLRYDPDYQTCSDMQRKMTEREVSEFDKGFYPESVV